MTERPILFSAPMVRALLAGTKTQTRRVVKRPERYEGGLHNCLHCCPYGEPGDRLWVRETWAPQVDCEVSAQRWTKLQAQHGPMPLLHFAADNEPGPWITKWRPSIHMPRWASRITLEVTEVRVERLQDISDADARAEGCVATSKWAPNVRDDYAALWESINGAGSWAANPWVWVVAFRRV